MEHNNVFGQLLCGGKEGSYSFKTHSGRIIDNSLNITDEGKNYILLSFPYNPAQSKHKDVFHFQRFVENKCVCEVEVPTNILNDTDRKEWTQLEKQILKYLLECNNPAVVKLDDKNKWHISINSKC